MVDGVLDLLDDEPAGVGGGPPSPGGEGGRDRTEHHSNHKGIRQCSLHRSVHPPRQMLDTLFSNARSEQLECGGGETPPARLRGRVYVGGTRARRAQPPGPPAQLSPDIRSRCSPAS